MQAKSIDQHKEDGTYRPDRHAAMSLSPIAAPPPPKELSKEAKRKWKEAAGKLASAGILTTLDLDALSAYCEAFAVWRQATDTLQKEGQTYGHGELKKPHPAVAIMQASAREMSVWASALGLTVASRRRMRIEPPKPAKQGLAVRDRSQGPPPPSHLAGRIS